MACAFNGTSQYLTVPVSSDFEFGTGDFTVSLNCRFNALGDNTLIGLGNGANGGAPIVESAWLIRYYNPTNLLYWYRYQHPTETAYTFAWTPSVAVNYNIVLTRTGTSLKAFINRNQIGSTITSSVSYIRVNTDNLNIGRGLFSGSSFFFNGNLSEIAIWKAGLTNAEITALATGFTPDQLRPQSLSFYLPLVSTIQDLRGAKVITNNNGATVATHPRIYT